MLFRGKESKYRCEYKQLRAALMKLEKRRCGRRSKRTIEKGRRRKIKKEKVRGREKKDKEISAVFLPD